MSRFRHPNRRSWKVFDEITQDTYPAMWLAHANFHEGLYKDQAWSLPISQKWLELHTMLREKKIFVLQFDKRRNGVKNRTDVKEVDGYLEHLFKVTGEITFTNNLAHLSFHYCQGKGEKVKKLLLAGLMLVLAAPVYATEYAPTQPIRGTAPILPPRFSAADDAANGITTYFGNEPPHWAPTMADAPSWLTKRYTYKRRLHR
jgi:hypothetical protein